MKDLHTLQYQHGTGLDQPPCEVYNPDDLAACKANGVAVTATEGAVQTIQVTAN